MSKEKKINIAKGLAVQLRATEEAIDTALAEAAHLIETYVASRRAVGLSTVIAGEVHENTLHAMLALNTAQKHMTAAHYGLERVQQQLGLGDVAIVEPDDKPDPEKDKGSGGIVPEDARIAADL